MPHVDQAVGAVLRYGAELLPAARAAGWTDRQLLETTALVALRTMTDYVDKPAETEIG
ncbi:hypothetical protein [Microbispora sp. CA-102843]|uniref:hypothetical protein n=1 Tax=Microbispora sp. CA-102843 TaxID=3239952 RepID=UPI003D8AC925